MFLCSCLNFLCELSIFEQAEPKKQEQNYQFEIFVYEGHNLWHTRYNNAREKKIMDPTGITFFELFITDGDDADEGLVRIDPEFRRDSAGTAARRCCPDKFGRRDRTDGREVEVLENVFFSIQYGVVHK